LNSKNYFCQVIKRKNNKSFGYDLEFTEPMKIRSKSYFQVTLNGELTTINWVYE